MSLLTPLYILGLSAIVAPIVFHLIRRSPRGEVPFSSLMFLSPTPPSVTRRSRLDHWLLLLLRATALALLAFAFARPFLRQPALLDNGEVPRRRIALLIDTSASMRRGDLWPRAKAMARQSDRRLPADRSTGLVFLRCGGAAAPGLRGIGDARPHAATGRGPGTLEQSVADLGRDEPGSSPDRRRDRDRGRRRCEREIRPNAAPGRPGQRPAAGEPAGLARRL